jgi:hypothetical protein
LQLDLALPSPPARVTCLWATYEPPMSHVLSSQHTRKLVKQSKAMQWMKHLKQSRLVHSLL